MFTNHLELATIYADKAASAFGNSLIPFALDNIAKAKHHLERAEQILIDELIDGPATTPKEIAS